MNKYYEMFRKNFPLIVRDERETLEIINNHENKIIEVNDDSGKLSIIHKNNRYTKKKRLILIKQ